jgi:hypothetical protein
MARQKYIDETIDPAADKEEERGRYSCTSNDLSTATVEWYKYQEAINVLPKAYAKFSKQEDFENAYCITKKFAEIFTAENGHAFFPENTETVNPNITCTLYQYQLKSKTTQQGILMNISGVKSKYYIDNIRNFADKCANNKLDKSFYEATKELELFIIDSLSDTSAGNLRIYQLYFDIPNQQELQKNYTCSEPTTYLEAEKLIQQGKKILGTAHFSVWMKKEIVCNGIVTTLDNFTVHDSCSSRCQEVAKGHYNYLNANTREVERVRDIPFYKFTNFFSPNGYKNSSINTPYILRELSPSRTVKLSAAVQDLDKHAIEKQLFSWSNKELVGFIKEMKSLLTNREQKNLNSLTTTYDLIDKNILPKNFIFLIRQSADKEIIKFAEEAYYMHCKEECLSYFNDGSYLDVIMFAFANKEKVLLKTSNYYDYPLPLDLLEDIEEVARRNLNYNQELINNITKEINNWNLEKLQGFINMEVKENLAHEQKDLITTLKSYASNRLIRKWKILCSNNIDANIYSEIVLIKLAFNSQAVFDEWLNSYSFKKNIILDSATKISVEKKAKKTLKESDDSQFYLRYTLQKDMVNWSIDQLKDFVNNKIITGDINRLISLINSEELMNKSTIILLNKKANNLLKEKQNLLIKEQELFKKAQGMLRECDTELLIEYQKIKSDNINIIKEFIQENFYDGNDINLDYYRKLITQLNQKISCKIAELKDSPEFDETITKLQTKINKSKNGINILQLVGTAFKNEAATELLSVDEWRALINDYIPKKQKKLGSTKNPSPMKEKQDYNKEERKVIIVNRNNSFFNRKVKLDDNEVIFLESPRVRI